VNTLRFHVGAVEPLKRPSWRTDTRSAPQPVPLPADVRSSLAQVPDDELRDALARAAAASLGYDQAGSARRSERRISPPTSRRSAAPDPRSAASRSAPPARTTPARRAARRGTSAGSSGRGS